MPRRVKDEDRVEMIIRGLLKQPENKRCINCNCLGPQYVCTTFWTFVCTSCSGVHREFTHRVKSVSMAKFNEEEIMALQAGGNDRAREIYFKEWDPQRNNYPDSSNLYRLREFVKHVYVDRKYAGGNSPYKLSMIKSDSRSNSLGSPSFDRRSNSGRRRIFTASFDDIMSTFYEKSYFSLSTFAEPWDKPKAVYVIHQTSGEVCVVWSILEDSRSNSLGSPSFDRRSNSGRSDTSLEKSSSAKKFNERDLKDMFEERSPRVSQENVKSSSNRGRPARFEIVDDRFRDDGSVKHYPRNINNEARDGSRSPAHVRTRATSLPAVCPIKDLIGDKIPSLRISGPPKANDVKDGEGSARSQRAADATNPEPLGQEQQQSPAVNTSSLIDFDDKPQPTNDTTEPPASKAASKDDNKSSPVASSTPQMPEKAPNMNSIESLLLDWSSPVSSPSASQTSATATDAGTAKVPEASNSVGDLAITVVNNDQPMQGTQQSDTSVGALYNQQSYQPADTREGTTPNSRKELPQDLFASHYASFAPPAAGWQMHLPYGTGYGMQLHPHAMSVAAYQSRPRARNPFDVGDDGPQAQPAMFPSMSPLHGAPPNMPASTAQPSPYAAALSSHMSPFGMNMALVPGAYMAQLPNNMPIPRPQGTANVNKPEDAFASLNPIKQVSGANSLPDATNSSAFRGANPFG